MRAYLYGVAVLVVHCVSLFAQSTGTSDNQGDDIITLPELPVDECAELVL